MTRPSSESKSETESRDARRARRGPALARRAGAQRAGAQGAGTHAPPAPTGARFLGRASVPNFFASPALRGFHYRVSIFKGVVMY